MEEPSQQVIPDQWPARSPKRSHSQMSAEHRHAQHDGLAEWVREATRTPAPNLDQVYLTTPAPPSPFTHLTDALRYSSPIHLDLRRSLDLRRPADPTRPPQQYRTPSVAPMPDRTTAVELIDLTDEVEMVDNEDETRQQEDDVQLIEDAYETVDRTFQEELERIFNREQEHEMSLLSDEEDQDHLFVQPRPAARGPRFGRDIIDLSEDTTPPPQHVPTLSPEVQFVRSRARSTPPPPAPDPPQVVDITASDDLDEEEDDDDVQFVREQHVPNPPNRDRPQPPPFLEPNLHPHFHGPQPGTYINAQWNQWLATSRLAQHFHHPGLRSVLAGRTAPAGPTPGPAQAHPTFTRIGLGRPAALAASFVAPIMNYGITAFDILGRDATTTPRPQAREESPIPVLDQLPEGFHRAPFESKIAMVCPHCGNELGAGDSDIKRQVWVIKACGHTYCGDCTTHRFKYNKGKGKAAAINAQRLAGHAPEPFSVCCVEGCGSKIGTKNTMIQLYL